MIDRNEAPFVVGKVDYITERLTKLGHEMVEHRASEEELFAVAKARDLLTGLSEHIKKDIIGNNV